MQPDHERPRLIFSGCFVSTRLVPIAPLLNLGGWSQPHCIAVTLVMTPTAMSLSVEKPPAVSAPVSNLKLLIVGDSGSGKVPASRVWNTTPDK
jgi:hypothetical protein